MSGGSGLGEDLLPLDPVFFAAHFHLVDLLRDGSRIETLTLKTTSEKRLFFER